MKLKTFIFLIIFVFNPYEKNAENVIDYSKKETKQNVLKSKVYCYNSDSLKIQLSVLKRNKQIKFNICIKTTKNKFNLNSNANLILVEDINGRFYVPEGTFILDTFKNEEYLCDSVYEYISDKIRFSFGFEKLTNKRVSFLIYKSKIDYIKNNEFTLYEKSH